MIKKFDEFINEGMEHVQIQFQDDKIPNDVKFIGDSCYKYGICTEQSIPLNTVIDIE